MENSKNKNLNEKDKLDIEHIWIKFADRLTNLSNKTILFFSILSSGYMSYKYLKNKEVYEEFNGHYNSPRNLLNQRMKYFHLQEAMVRFGMGVLFIGGGSFILFKKVLREYLNKENEKNKKDDEKNYLNASRPQLEIDEIKKLLPDKNLIALNDYAMNEEKVYELNETFERTTRVENYLNNKK
jgi:hypothetical protein